MNLDPYTIIDHDADRIQQYAVFVDTDGQRECHKFWHKQSALSFLAEYEDYEQGVLYVDLHATSEHQLRQALLASGCTKIS
jgi:hypothetical protein